ncbi:unnamed protein product, partial [Vitis vinifera]
MRTRIVLQWLQLWALVSFEKFNSLKNVKMQYYLISGLMTANREGYFTTHFSFAIKAVNDSVYNSATKNLSVFLTYADNPVFSGNSTLSYVVDLTKVLPEWIRVVDDSLTSSTGRASYAEPVRLWDASTGRLTNFTTHFSFAIKAVNDSVYGDGLSLFLAPFDSRIPPDSSGGYLALFSAKSAFNTSQNKIIAVEFDSRQDEWDPSSDHVGININSIISVQKVQWKSSIKNGSRANAWVSYNSATKNLSVFLTYADNPVFSGNSTLSYVVDLTKVLPEWIRVGFSAATGESIELHTVYSWEFESTLEASGGKGKKSFGLVVALVVTIGVLTCGSGGYWFIWWRKRVGPRKEDMALELAIDDEFEKGTGPKRFTYRELSHATKNFSEEGKLGEGGFGGQGKKEYVSEVKIISRLRHRNLVQLIGWCHEHGELLLVYEFMPNGSLDTHLFGGNSTLTWTVRAEPSKTRLVEWVWSLYGKGQLFEAVDKGLSMEFDQRQMECLMTVGLWCCHPDSTHRPSIRQVINVLSFEAPLPNLPMTMPVPMYFAPPMHMCTFSYTSSATPTDSQSHQSGCSCNICTSDSSMSLGSSKALLKLPKPDV